MNEWEEDLKEGNKLLHYTDAKGLQKMLEGDKDGKQFIKAKNYDYSLDKNDDAEVAFIRKSASPVKRTNKKYDETYMTDRMRQITDKDVEVEIIVKTDELKNSVRGIKQTKIAEYVIRALISMKNYFNKVVELLKNKPVAQRYIFTKFWNSSIYNKNEQKFIEDYYKIRKPLQTYAHDLLLKGDAQTSTKLNDLNHSLYFAISLYEKYTKQREGEERVNKNVPLNSKYLQIRLLASILTSKYKNDEYLRTLIKKNSNLFIKNETYDTYMGNLKENTYLKRVILTT
jgi:hypothetical protein